MVVFAAFNLAHKIWCCSCVRNNRILESSDARFECVASVKKHHVVSALFHQLVDLAGREVLAASDDAVFINLDFIRITEGN